MAVAASKNFSPVSNAAVSEPPGKQVMESLETLENLTKTIPSEFSDADESNLALAPEEVATLASLMQRYDKVLVEVNRLNAEIESMLEVELPRISSFSRHED